MSDQSPPSHRPSVGRAAPRSRLGCLTCKQRHVRCDEALPACGHCSRLKLGCSYLTRPRNTKTKDARSSTSSSTAQRKLLPATRRPAPLPPSGRDSPDSRWSAGPDQDVYSNQQQTPPFNSLPWWDDVVMVSATDLPGPAINTNWAGEMALEAFMTPGIMPFELGVSEDLHDNSHWSFNTEQTDLKESFSDSVMPTPPPNDKGERPDQVLRAFGNIMHPPAAMLMGGIKKWRHLQRYLIDLGSRNDAVMNGLLCLEELLAWDDSSTSTQTKDHFESRIAHLFNASRHEIEKCLSRNPPSENDQMDEWLAAIFLLAWSQVIRDRGKENSETSFPSHLADRIITNSCTWSWYSRELLSWFNSFDSKASYLGGQALLSPEALKVVSRYPIQIISCDYEDSKDWQESLNDDGDFEAMTASTVSEASHGDTATIVPSLTPCDVKEIVLRAILQPAAEWYLQTQAFWRRISALDKHHRKRFTPDAEIEVAVAGKRLQTELWDLWAQRPSVISLTSTNLADSVAVDMATRLEEIFSVYLASYWILFVYLHRVCWWHLAHTPTVTGALRETWRHMQSSYGESDTNSQQKIVHPSLMWPVFLLGAETNDEDRRVWAIEQLQALGKSKPVLRPERRDHNTLPAFRMCQGATKNAKRAALLLQALIQKQREMKCRVDDRDLAMRMFGCYFSIV